MGWEATAEERKKHIEQMKLGAGWIMVWKRTVSKIVFLTKKYKIS